MKKIIHVIIGLDVGGAESMLKKLVRSQVKDFEKYEHSVVSLTTIGAIGKELKQEGVEVKALGMNTAFSSFLVILKLIKIFKFKKPDVVQTWMYHADLIGGVAAAIAGVKCILWGIRSTNIRLGNSRLTSIVQKVCALLSYHIPTKIVCVAEKSMNAHVNAGYDKSKMLVINNGFDLERFLFAEKERKKIRDNLGVKNNFVIGSVGRFNPAKNHFLLISVVEKIIPYGVDIVFLLVGRGVNNTENEFYKKIKEKGLLSYFLLIGEVSDIRKYYQAMDVFCLHSDTEGFPNVLGEAMASGLPCISTDAGDARKILGDDSMVVDCGDADGIAERIVRLQRLSSLERGRMGKVNMEKIKENYSIKKISQKFQDLY